MGKFRNGTATHFAGIMTSIVVCKETEMKAAHSEVDALEDKFLLWNKEQGKNPLLVVFLVLFGFGDFCLVLGWFFGLFWVFLLGFFGWGKWFDFFFS